MVLLAAAFLAGQLFATLGIVPTSGVWVLAALGTAILARRGAPRLEPASRALAAAVLASWSGPGLEPATRDCWLPADDAVAKRWIVATVVERVVPTEPLRVTVAATLDGAEGKAVCGSTRLSLRTTPPVPLHPGDRLRAHASLRRPRDFANPSGFAYTAALARREIFTVGGVQRVDHVEAGPDGVARRIDRLRSSIREAIESAAPEREARLLRAVVLGESSSVDGDLRDALAAAGLAHLLAVSGLHVGAVWAGLAIPLRLLLGRSERLLLAIDVRVVAAALAMVPALAYAALAGGALPAERATAFVALGVVAAALGRETRPVRVFALAALLLSALHPGAIRTISFQLSFAAVAGLLIAVRLGPFVPEDSPRLARWIEAAARLAAAATIATAPIAALHFNRVAPIGLLANPLLVPLLGVPGTLLGLAGSALSVVWHDAGAITLAAAARLLGALADAAIFCASIPGAALRVPTPSLLEVAILYGAAAALGLRGRARAGVLLLLAILAIADAALWARARRGDGLLRVRFLDVGQGDAAIVELPDGRVLVIDGGGSPSDFDVGERVVAPALWARKVARVDVLIASHGDRDHQGGLGFLARELSPRELWIPDAPREIERLTALVEDARRAGARVRTLRSGWRIDDPSGVIIECLHPPRGFAGSSNDGSLVLRLTHEDVTIVFTGDIERAAEASVFPAFDRRRVDLWKVPHHGSATSSADPLLRHVRPRLAVVSAGAGNPFGVPRPEVLRRYRRFGARVFRTDRDGSVAVTSDGRDLRVRTTDGGVRLACSALGALC